MLFSGQLCHFLGGFRGRFFSCFRSYFRGNLFRHFFRDVLGRLLVGSLSCLLHGLPSDLLSGLLNALSVFFVEEADLMVNLGARLVALVTVLLAFEC